MWPDYYTTYTTKGLNKNDMIFNKTQVATSMHLIFRGTLDPFLDIAKRKDWPQFTRGCRVLETSIMEVFATKMGECLVIQSTRYSDKDMAIFLDLDQVLVLLFDPFFSVVSEACEENGFVIKKTRCMILFLACLVTYGADS
jgi:hypothetical protein